MTRSVKSSHSYPYISSVASLVEAQNVTSFVSFSQQESQSSTFSLFQNDSNEKKKIRVSYTWEQKLVTITYFLTTTKSDKHNVIKPIIKYEVTKNLRITSIMLRKWIKNQKEVKNLTKGTRKDRRDIPAKESEIKRILNTAFLSHQKEGCIIRRWWFLRNARLTYASLHLNKVSKDSAGKLTYNEFKFFSEWFNDFHCQYEIFIRATIKKAQAILKDFHEKIVSWLQFNYHNSQLLPSTFTLTLKDDSIIIERFRLCDITNINQTSIAYEFLNARTYAKRGDKTV